MRILPFVNENIFVLRKKSAQESFLLSQIFIKKNENENNKFYQIACEWVRRFIYIRKKIHI